MKCFQILFGQLKNSLFVFMLLPVLSMFFYCLHFSFLLFLFLKIFLLCGCYFLQFWMTIWKCMIVCVLWLCWIYCKIMLLLLGVGNKTILSQFLLIWMTTDKLTWLGRMKWMNKCNKLIFPLTFFTPYISF